MIAKPVFYSLLNVVMCRILPIYDPHTKEWITSASCRALPTVPITYEWDYQTPSGAKCGDPKKFVRSRADYSLNFL